MARWACNLVWISNDDTRAETTRSPPGGRASPPAILDGVPQNLGARKQYLSSTWAVHRRDGRLLQGQALHRREKVLPDCGPITKEHQGPEDSFISISQSPAFV